MPHMEDARATHHGWIVAACGVWADAVSNPAASGIERVAHVKIAVKLLISRRMTGCWREKKRSRKDNEPSPGK